MPLYEYKCNLCERISEILHKISDPTPSECPACGKTGSLIKILSPSAFHLKGGGWYADAYSSKSKDTTTKPATGETTSSTKEAPSPKAGSSESSTSSSSSKPSSSSD